LGYQTQIWTLIGALFGAIIGFFLSLIAIGITNKRNYKKFLDTITTKIVSYIRDNNAPVAIQAISELEASFKEQDQIKILERASLESSLNASNNKVTEYILDKLEWMMMNYNVYLNGSWKLEELGLNTKKDRIKMNSIHSIIWTILRDVVEYHQSESIIKKGFQLIEELDKFSLVISNYELLRASIMLYLDIGTKSIGIEYPNGFKVLNYQIGTNLSTDFLQRMYRFISNYREYLDPRSTVVGKP
jgi:hypothetical protein